MLKKRHVQVFLVVFIAIINSPSGLYGFFLMKLIQNGNMTTYCVTNYEEHFLAVQISIVIYYLLTVLAPFVVIMTTTVLLIRAKIELNKKVKISGIRRQKEFKFILTILMVNMSFIIFKLPNMFSLIIRFTANNQNVTANICNAIFFIMTLCYHSISFLFYLFNNLFRKSITALK